MALRIDQTLVAGESAEFSATDNFIVQILAEEIRVTVDVMARVDAAAEWQLVDTVSSSDRFARFAAVPFVKLAYKGNKQGKSVKVWTSV